jgi:hypothetical protein
MKYLLPLIFLILSLTAHAANTVDKFPKGCIYSCEGWEFHYDGKQPDGKDELNVAVYNKQLKPPNDKADWAKTQADAQKIADVYAKKAGLLAQ